MKMFNFQIICIIGGRLKDHFHHDHEIEVIKATTSR